MPTKILTATQMSDDEKALVGGFEVKTLCGANLSENAKKTIREKMTADSISTDGETRSYCVMDGVIDTFLSDDDCVSELTQNDIDILNAICDRFAYFEV